MTTTCKSNHSNLHQAQVEQEGPEVILSHQESKSDPKIRGKIQLPGRGRLLCQKSPKSEIRQNLIQLNEIGPNPASNDCQRRRSPRASIDCQEKEPQSQQCQEVIPNPAKNRLARKSSLGQKKSKSEIRQNLIQLNEIGPNLASNDCQRRRSPSASIDCQWRRIPRASRAKRSSQP